MPNPGISLRGVMEMPGQRPMIKVRKINQIGIAVHNIEKTMENYWNILGIGPWTIINQPPPYMYNRLYRGKPAYFVTKVALAQLGNVELELMSNTQGHNVYDDFLAEHGEGVQHLQYTVDTLDEIDKQAEMMAQMGFPSVMSGGCFETAGFNYVDATSALGTVWEIVRYPDKFNVPMLKYPADESATSPAKIRVKEVCQITLVVKDLGKAMENYWKLLGVGPWEVFTAEPPALRKRFFYGKPANYMFKFAVNMEGPVKLKLVQPISGDSVYLDFISKHGSGISGLAFSVEDIAETTKIMENEGFPVIQSGEYGGSSFACYDTFGLLKVAWEAFEPPSTEPSPDSRYPE
jgi:hypothetical protein